MNRSSTTKAVLFSNFPKDVYVNTLKPKFEQHGIDVLKVINIDRSPNPSVSDADIVIAMVELMSSGQRQKVKEVARKYGKRFVGLHRKGVDWHRDLFSATEPVTGPLPKQDVLLALRTGGLSLVPPITPEAPSSEPEPPEPTTEDLQELLKMFEEENEKLEDEKTELLSRLKKTDELAGSLERRLHKSESDFKLFKGQYNDLVKCKDETDKLCVNLRKELDEVKGQKVTSGGMDKAMMHFKELWKMGFLTSDDILKKIFKE